MERIRSVALAVRPSDLTRPGVHDRARARSFARCAVAATARETAAQAAEEEAARRETAAAKF